MSLLRGLSIASLFVFAACKGSDNPRSSEQHRDGTGQTGMVRESQGPARSVEGHGDTPPTAAIQPQGEGGAASAAGATGATDAGVGDAAGGTGTTTADGGTAAQGGTGGATPGATGGGAGGTPSGGGGSVPSGGGTGTR